VKPDLEKLARDAVRGNAAALSAVVEALEGPVFRLCQRMLSDVRDAEDAAQDVLVKVVTNLSQFEGRSALSTWAQQIAVRHVLALKKSRAEQHAIDEDDFAALLAQGLAFSATAPPPSPEDRALLTEVRLTCTQGMLLMLSRDERLALVLVDLLGFEGTEAAEIAEVAYDAFRQRLSRARARLSAFLERECGEANAEAKCSCAKQVPAKRALGLSTSTQKLRPLSQGDVQLAHAELKSMRHVASAFHRDGLFGAPASLRARMQAVLPTVLGR
jgi:RNA polymerase sigma factor (sigma-70 family)